MGNARRGDDAAGLLVAEAVARRAPGGVTVIGHEGDGAELMGLWEGFDRVIVVDAMRSGSSPGSVRCIQAHAETVAPDTFHYSSHAFGLAEGIETARAIGALPGTLLVYGIEGTDFGMGSDCTRPVVAVIPSLADRILGEAAALLSNRGEVAPCTN
jgi:hydrogenase maturation protease